MPTPNTADPNWDLHKAKIESLYVKNKLPLEGPGGLRETMARDHGFAKKKWQYESQFKIWGMRKYGKRDDWRSIGRKIAERERAGKESDVYNNSKLIPKSRVQKQIRRNAFTPALERNLSAPSPRMPDGFEIRTPAAEEIAHLIQQPQDTTLSSTETRDCVSSQLQSVLSAMPSQIVTNDASLLWNAMSSSPPMIPTDLSPIRSQNAIPSPPYVPGIHGSPPFLFEDVDEIFKSLNLIYDLPFCQFEDGLHIQFEPSLISTNAQIFMFELTPETISLPDHHHDTFSKDVDVLHEVLKGSQTLTAVLKALLPSAVRSGQGEEQVILSPYLDRSDSAYYKLFSLLIFAMANNFAGLNSVSIDQILEYLNGQTSDRLLQHLLSISGPESEAFAEKLFQAAILMEYARIVKILLQNGLVPNDLVCVQHGWKYTPLEYSSMVWNTEITRLLLNANLDVNKSLAGEIDSGGALNRALGWHWWHNEYARKSIPSELVHMLLEAGGKFSWSNYDFRILQGNQEVLELLVDNSFKTKTYKQAWDNLVKDISACDDATVAKLYTRFLKAGATLDYSSFASLTLPSAAERGNLELVQLLLSYRSSPIGEILTCAIRSKNKELIRLLLDDEADVFALEERATEQRYDGAEVLSPAPSPLSEAIRWGDAEILDLLEAKGAWSRIVSQATTRGEFEDVLIAASVRGKITTVQKLLCSRPPNTYGKDLSDALVAAIYLNKDAIVLTLLDAGANVNGGSYEASDIDDAVEEGFDCASSIDAGTKEDFRECSRRGPALVEALLQKNEHLVRLILDADVDVDDLGMSTRGPSSKMPLEAAVEWGNLSIIKEVISMSNFRGCGALEFSVRKKNLEYTQLLVNAGIPMGGDELRIAVCNNDIEMVEYLFSLGAEVNSDALFEAGALPNGLPMIERLLTEFARRYPHGSLRYGSNPFGKAIQQGEFALVKLLLDAKINLDLQYIEDLDDLKDSLPSPERNLLGVAIRQRHTTSLAICERLLNEIGNPNIIVQTSAGNTYRTRETALLVAIDTKDIQKVQWLIDAGANVNWPATKGVKRTPLQKAAEIGSYEITQLLIDQDALVNNDPAVRGGATALQLAAIGGYIGIAELLLKNRAQVNAPAAKFYGRIALEGAAEHGRIDMLKLLCNAGAEFHGDEYERARELAKENGHMATWRYLEKLYWPPEEISMDT